MPELRVLIAAAGSGSRAGLPYPKTLHPVLGRPILVRLLELLRPLDPRPVVVVSPAGRAPISETLATHDLEAELVEQAQPTGMGDAILCGGEALARAGSENMLIVWGDIPLIQAATVQQSCAAHLAGRNDLTFPTRHVDAAYTLVHRDEGGRVVDLVETREAGTQPGPGERDIGLFVARTGPVLSILAERLPGGSGRSTGEHGFLYIVRHLAARGARVEALPIATELDLISLNRLSDLDAVGNGSAGG